MYYGGNIAVTTDGMKAHMKLAGYGGIWPAWVNQESCMHLTKSGAQSWIKHLLIAAKEKE